MEYFQTIHSHCNNKNYQFTGLKIVLTRLKFDICEICYGVCLPKIHSCCHKTASPKFKNCLKSTILHCNQSMRMSESLASSSGSCSTTVSNTTQCQQIRQIITFLYLPRLRGAIRYVVFVILQHA